MVKKLTKREFGTTSNKQQLHDDLEESYHELNCVRSERDYYKNACVRKDKVISYLLNKVIE